MNTIVLSVFKSLLQKSRELETKQLILSTLKEITAWGGRRHHYSEHGNNHQNETEQLLADPIKYWTSQIQDDADEDDVDETETEDNDEERKESKRQIAPENMQEGLKKVATTHRSPIQREDALARLPEDFLIEQVKNPKQHTRVRLLAIELLIQDKSKSVDTFAQDNSLPKELKEAAINGTSDKKILLKAAKDGYGKALYKLDLKHILEFPKDIVKNVFKGSSWATGINWKEKLKEATPAQRKEFITTFADDFNDQNFFSALIPYIKEIKDNKDILLKVFEGLPDYNPYYKKAKANILIKLKDDKDFLKKVIFDSEDRHEDDLFTLALALYGGKNKEFYTKLAQTKEFNNLGYVQKDFVMLQIDDQDVLKKILSKKDSSYYHIHEKVLEKIKDQKFLKDLFVRQDNANILQAIDDDDFKKKLYEKEKSNNYLRYITDEKYLKEVYQNNMADKGDDRKSKEHAADIRKAAINNIKDIDFLQKIAKKDSSYEVRLAAIRSIDDPAILEALVLRESSKTAKMNMLNAIDNQDVLMAFRRKEKDTEVQRRIDSRLSEESILTLIKDGILIAPNDVSKIKRDVLKPIIIQNSSLVDEYRHLFLKDEKFLLDILKKYPNKAPDVINFIKDQKVLLKLFKEGFVKDIGYEGIENLTDPKLLRIYLIENGNQKVLDVFEKLNPSQDELLDIIKNTHSAKVKSEGTKLLLTDPNVLKKVLLKAPCNMDMFKNSWSQIKDDKEFLAKFVMLQTDLEIIEKVLPKISDNDAVIKELLSNTLKNIDSFGYGVTKYIKALIHNITDKDYIAKSIMEQDDVTVIQLMAAKISDKTDVIETLITKLYGGVNSKTDAKNTFDELFEYVKHDTKFLQKFVATQKNPHIIGKILPEIPENKKLFKQLLTNIASSTDWKSDEIFADLLNFIDDADYVKSILFSLNKNRFNKIVVDTLAKSPKEIENILLHTDSSDFGKIETLVNTLPPDYAGDMQLFKKTNNNTVKQAITIWIKPDLFTKDMVDEFVAGLQQTERPYEVHPDLKAKAYEWGTDSQQDILKGFVDESLWNQRHREAMDRPYTTPDRRRGVKHKAIEHDVEKNPNYQMFRLLVSLAR